MVDSWRIDHSRKAAVVVIGADALDADGTPKG